jgi:hypothetical protein
MRRDIPDFHYIRPEHAEVHRLLIEWARWVRPGRGGAGTHPMFRAYVPYLYPETGPSAVPINTLRAQETERAVAALPMEQEIRKRSVAIRWCYVFPHIPVRRVKDALGWKESELVAMLHDSREMLSCLI